MCLGTMISSHKARVTKEAPFKEKLKSDHEALGLTPV